MNLNDAWYQKRANWTLLLWPVELLFWQLSAFNKRRLLKKQWHAPCPLIVVGNISVGGTGKSPLTIDLITTLTAQGYKVGVVSRGYGSKRDDFPYQVKATDTAEQSADEPLMIVQRTKVNLVIDPDRVRACQFLLANNRCDLIISDDGLQHYKMGRDIEIAVIDGARGLGNRHCLPVGPLREPAERLNSVDFVVVNQADECAPASIVDKQFCMRMQPIAWCRLSDNVTLSLAEFKQLAKRDGAQLHAIAGIGNPERFYSTLRRLGIDAVPNSFPDHHQYQRADFKVGDRDIICMTEKDAVKCKNIAPANSYYLKIAAQLDEQFIQQLIARLQLLKRKNAAG